MTPAHVAHLVRLFSEKVVGTRYQEILGGYSNGPRGPVGHVDRVVPPSRAADQDQWYSWDVVVRFADGTPERPMALSSFMPPADLAAIVGEFAGAAESPDSPDLE